MPYIAQEDRAQLDPTHNMHEDGMPATGGELNYQITRLCQAYMALHGERYEHYNAVIGALECCKLEFYARAVRPYEDTKIEQNGDVF